MTVKKLTTFLLGIIAIILSVVIWNYLTVWKPVSTALATDPRNNVVSVATYHQHLIKPSVLVFDLRSISGETSQLDVMRALFQAAESLQASSFNEVILAYKGTPKFKISGDYFKKMGDEYSWQNPIYLTRSFAENTLTLQDKRAFSTWTGGALGVIARQMDDLKKLHHQWYIDEWITDPH